MGMQLKLITGTPGMEKAGAYVGWDDYEVGSTLLWTDGIGPCLAIALYVPELKKGALAHISGVRCSGLVSEAVYPENIVNTMISKLGIYHGIEAALAGEDHTDTKISNRVKLALNSLHIPIIGKDLGNFGSYRGREVHLNCQTGELCVYRYPPLF